MHCLRQFLYSQTLGSLVILIAIINVTFQSTREFNIDRHYPTSRSKVIRDLSDFCFCTFIVRYNLAYQTRGKLSYHCTNVFSMEYLRTDGLVA